MSNKTKKQLLLNLPYFIAGLVCTNLGEAWRIAEGADMSEKLLGFLSALGAAFSNPMPSLHPMDMENGRRERNTRRKNRSGMKSARPLMQHWQENRKTSGN